jgi:hypothetical protein
MSAYSYDVRHQLPSCRAARPSGRDLPPGKKLWRTLGSAKIKEENRLTKHSLNKNKGGSINYHRKVFLCQSFYVLSSCGLFLYMCQRRFGKSTTDGLRFRLLNVAEVLFADHSQQRQSKESHKQLTRNDLQSQIYRHLKSIGFEAQKRWV